MAFPTVQEAIESNTTSAGTSHVVTLPTATAGQLLLIILDKGSTAATINAHTELTELLDENLANGLYIAYRWMDGAEPASYTLTSSASTKTARIAYRISGAENPATQAPQIGTTGTGTSATPDPPSSATPGSTKDYLFIAFYGGAGEEADDDTWSDTPPTSYTPSPPRQKACGIAGTNLGGMIAAAERQLNTGSAENPGTFTKDVSVAWRSQTVMVHPASISPTRGKVSWAELETPFVATRGRVSWAELETPFVQTRGRISFAELEAPLAPTRGRLSFVELEVPSLPSDPTRGRVSFAELEVPSVATRGLISWAEFEVPTSGGSLSGRSLLLLRRRRRQKW